MPKDPGDGGRGEAAVGAQRGSLGSDMLLARRGMSRVGPAVGSCEEVMGHWLQKLQGG